VTAAGPALALALTLTGAPASTGTGIQASPVCLPAPAQPGHTYPLGTVYVTDTGTSTASLNLAAAPLWPGQRVYKGERAISPSWVTFTPATVTLSPGQGASVPATLAVPAGAPRGIYVANIVAGPQASPAPSGSGEHAQLAAAAATLLIFTAGEPAPSCTLPPAPGSPWAAQYAPLQPQERVVSMTWLKKHLPWVFGKHAPGQAAAAAQAASTPAAHTATAATAAAKDRSTEMPVIIAVLAAGALMVVLSWRRARRGSRVTSEHAGRAAVTP
jgi:hypothetical protein